MPRVSTGAARVWLEPEFGLAGSLPPYPAPPGTWHELFAAMEVEAAEHALKAVRLQLSIWRKPNAGYSDETRDVLDAIVERIDAQIAAVNAFAWEGAPTGHAPMPTPRRIL